METILVWILVGSIASTSQNRAPVFVDNLATLQDCERVAKAVRDMHLWRGRGDNVIVTDAKVACVEVRKVKQ